MRRDEDGKEIKLTDKKQIFKLVEDQQINADDAMELLDKLQNHNKVVIYTSSITEGHKLKCGNSGKVNKNEEKTVSNDVTVKEKNDVSRVPCASNINQNRLMQETLNYLKNLLSSELRQPKADLDIFEDLGGFGLDSIVIRRVNIELENTFGPLSSTLFFEYTNINDLADYFMGNHGDKLNEIFCINGNETISISDSENDISGNIESKAGTGFVDDEKYKPVAVKYETKKYRNEDIAIIGVCGRYPGADNLDEFWENLKNGIDCITEIPAERWDYSRFYDPDKKKSDKSCCKWGGFITDVDKFDPLFFNISPREAELMDPQERLFLETVWSTIEDAGYSSKSIKDSGERVGVFAGITWGSYQLLGAEEWNKGNMVIPKSLYWSLANRVSYFFDFQGPSMPVDTACSSSLTAIHMACESIKRGECKAAIAGGVNLYLHPSKYISMSQMKFVSSDGKCRSFGEGGDGYVPGEGVGAIFLKPLKDAVADGDQVYAIIKGTSINHGGKTNSYTVPNPNAQADLVSDAIGKADINPRTISYIEAHGTGTSLGDPIEITGLKKSFTKHTNDKQFCAIGSVKSNIGHLESAAGIAALTKVLLQIKHGLLVPTLHSDKINRDINFEDSPFYLQHTSGIWERPNIKDNIKNEMKEYPRRAGISSFGAGGANAHIIIEEFNENDYIPAKENRRISKPEIVILSARNTECLSKYAESLRDYVKSDIAKVDGSGVAGSPRYLGDIAYTLQTGRDAFDERLAVVAESCDELVRKLDDYLNGAKGIEGVYRGRVKSGGSPEGWLGGTKEEKDFVLQLFNARRYSKIAAFWVEGAEIDWEVFNRNKGFRRISLPTYPFARERYWISTSDASGKMDTGIVRGLHPLVDVNESTLEEERFRKSFTGSEFYLKDHVVAGKETLPGVAYIEMARAAGEIAKGSPVTSIRNIVWASPITIDSKNREGREVIISIYPGDSTIGFEVSTEQEGGGKIVHTQGKIAYGPGDNRQVDLQTGEKEFAIEVIKGRCTAIKKREDIYRRFKAAGISYGTGFQCIEEIRSNGREALSRIKIPEVVKSGVGDYVLHPSLMDGALQSVMGLAEDDEAFQSGFYLPFALGGVEIIRPLTESCYAYVTIGDGDKKAGFGVKRYDISILDESGEVLVRLKGFSVRALRGGDLNKRISVEVVESNERYYHPVWERVELTGTGESRETGTILLLDRGEKEKGGQWLNREEIVKGGKIIHVIPGTAYKKLAANRYEIDPESSEDYEKLFKELGVRGLMPASILHTWNYVKEAGGLPNSKEALDSSLKMGIYAVFNISNAMMKCKIKERVRLLYLFDSTKGGVQPQDAALGGFAKTIRQENPKFDYRTIQIDSAEADSVVLDWVVRELQTEENQDHVEVLYRDNERYVRKVEEFVPEKIEKREKSGKESTIPASVPLKENGVYVITGGAGGLGLIFSRYLSEKYRAKLVLTGRSEVDEEIGEKLKGIEELGGEVVYLQADVCSNTDMEKVVREAKQRYGSVDGVIHGAGVIEDVFVMKKDKGSFERVLGPKVYGLLNLDRVTVEEELDFFVMFSSLASVIGNIGQSDYASGNRYMDSYAELRERLRGEGKRSGVSLSINWPLWKDGGMRLHEESERMLFKISGMKPLGSEAGIRAFECALASGKSQCIVIDGEREKVNRLLQISESAGIAVEEATEDSGAFSETGIKDDDLKGRVQQEMIGLLSEQLKVEKSEIDIDADISEYGVDSIMIMNMMNEMEQRYGKVVEASVIMEHPTVSSMSDYLIEKKIIPLERIFGTTEDTKIEVVAEGDINRLKEEAVILPIKRTQRPRFVDSKSVGVKGIARPEGGPESGKIAIIGMSGCFPGSKDLERFWENLRDGKDLIMDVPEQRWNIEEYFSLDKAAFNKAYSRWGGFIEDIEMFDAGFFGISESDAAGIDPQHRILLERTQELLDRCGYTKDEMSRSRTGVYIGGGSSKYNSMGEFSGDQAGNIVVNLIQNMMAARISDFYDLRGPSLTMDTACSSSLVAIHNACQCLRGGEIEMAITGGVELLLDSSGHVAFSQAKVLSDDGVSHVFDKKANGFVLGEGSGLVLLKRLENAIRDGDQIDGVILGSAVNNDGHTMGLTTPNLEAQREVIEEAISNSGVSPDSISYLEAHGTGTLLGDPIEIKAATQVYRKYTQGRQVCGVGSVKSNIGHLLRAAGVASFIKVVLALKHRQIPPTLHCEDPHPRFRFDESPFYPVTELEEWRQREGVRRSGISSFGFGGTNCHMIVEEFDNEKRGYKPERNPLPLTQFHKKRYWIGNEYDDSNTIGFDEQMNSLNTVYTQEFTYNELLLKDHTVFDEQVLLGVTHCSMVIDAARLYRPGKGLIQIKRLLLLDPVKVFPGETVTVNIDFKEDDGSIHFYSKYFKASDSRQHESANGELIYDAGIKDAESINISEIMKNAKKTISGADVYRRLAKNNIIHGPSLQVLSKAYCFEDKVLGELVLKNDILNDGKSYYIHPGLLDGSVVSSLCSLSLQDSDNNTFVPLFIKQVDVYGALPDRCYCLSNVKKTNSEILVIDVGFYNEIGELLLKFYDFSCKRVNSREIFGAQSVDDADYKTAKEFVHSDSNGYVQPGNEDVSDNAGGIRELIEKFIVKQIRQILNDSNMTIELDKNFMDLGVNSTSLIETTRKLEKDLRIELYPTLFFEYQNIKELTDYFYQEHKGKISEYFNLKNTLSNSSTSVQSDLKQNQFTDKKKQKKTSMKSIQKQKEERIDIAIIGMSGRFASSGNLDELWQNLKEGRDLIKEVPGDHWDYRPWYDPDPEAVDKTYCKWGSFIEDIDKFDPLFFNISPREAKTMDPQLRILMEVLYETIEDAGYCQKIKGSRTGMYVGVCFHDYAEEMARQNKPVDPYDGTGTAATMLANRPSYFFDLKGPSLSVDTACSSSLVALHLACKAIQNGECDMAFTGGTNLILSPNHYVYFSSIGALSPSGRSHTFDKAADGYVPGEGVAAVLLKPLQDAVRDGDNIHAVIKGTSINHGGYTNTITAPSPKLEAEVIINAWKDAEIDPETVSYIEAHGTGTKLGDPIEITGLRNAFSQFTKSNEFCHIGSVKANIGHTEGAAGLAGVIKVVLSMKNRQIPPMPQFKELNPYIRLNNTPLLINNELINWKTENGNPRRAGVSSFGFGGAYAHAVLEEFTDDKDIGSATLSGYDTTSIIVLSAKSRKQLDTSAGELRDFLNKDDGDSDLRDVDGKKGKQNNVEKTPTLRDIAYSLQTGREVFEERLAVIVNTKTELIEKLDDYVKGEKHIENLLTGRLELNNSAISLIQGEDEVNTLIHKLFKTGDYLKIASLWVAGLEINWEGLYVNGTQTRISLPTYPFMRERYWMDTTNTSGDEIKTRSSHLHPLIDVNESTLEEEAFRKTFHGNEFYLQDHVVMGREVLPGVAYLEMARAAADLASKRFRVKKMKNTVWIRPISTNGKPANISITLNPKSEFVDYEVFSDGDNQKYVHCQGQIIYELKDSNDRGFISEKSFEKVENISKIEIDLIRKKCSVRKNSSEFYRILEKRGLSIGPRLQSIQELYSNGSEVLAKLKLPDEIKGNRGEYILHPTLMDGALQSIVGFDDTHNNNYKGLYLPFFLGEVDIIRPLIDNCYVYVRASSIKNRLDNGSRAFDIDVIDDEGYPVVKIKNISFKSFIQKNHNSDFGNDDLRKVLRELKTGNISLEEADTKISQAGANKE
ncbi:beta-ketoacyl synthase [Candidatus Scalindua japonica]|uniref:Beta-ketoacyl synthase n=1 Tax=Candidatus Scalindua japonica TaxID=1284222 RepID=A0A286TTF0_9BACT|nr:SDR family NAD(P)-dependent oxidoreductase [Candidatus Scalindua japonica]GAX59141.1 beta-ketoacyl synthase [Candidatus Scalindua japonica]